MKSAVAIFPERVSVIGGGRWGRILTEIACHILPTTTDIYLYSPGNAVGMKTWASATETTKRIKVFRQFPEMVVDSATHAVIVVNAVRDHAKAIAAALTAGADVLVEKPMTMDYATAVELTALATQHNRVLAPAHVFLFARYLTTFTEMVRRDNIIRSIDFTWTDPRLEKRYGEQKMYDQGLPVFADWLPHILPVISKIVQGTIQKLHISELTNGGATVKLDLVIDNTNCTITMKRNGSERIRLMKVLTDQNQYILDFSSEPGYIIAGSQKISSDPLWETEDRPATAMIRTFLSNTATRRFDHRFDIDIGLEVLRVIDEMAVIYKNHQADWLVSHMKREGSFDKNVAYMISELLQKKERLDVAVLEQKMELIKQAFSGEQKNHNLEVFKRNQNFSHILEMNSGYTA